MNALGDLNQFAKYQSAIAIDDAAKNGGGAAGTSLGVGAGIALGQQMGNFMNPAGTPPPIPAGFFVAVNGAQTGPFDINALSSKARGGSLTRDTLVWRPGMPEWTAAGAIGELAALFPATPPPLPG